MAFLNVLLLVSLVAAAATGSEVNRTFCQTGRYEDIPLIEVKTGETLCIMTKNYPADYKKKQNSRLTIKHMDPNAHLEVIMEKGLTMEMKYGQCRDSLMVNTGARGDMDKMCDAVEPFNKVSVGNTAIIQFISNSNRVAAGSGGIKICLRAVGEWGDWGEWSLCSKNCKGGTTTRTRDCIGDFPCAEEDGSEMMDCNENIPCIAPCPTDWILQEFDGISYYYCYVKTNMKAPDAEKKCLNMGSKLTSINSQEEKDFIKGLLTRSTWIGLTDRLNEGTFTWMDGKALNYRNWASGQPRDSRGVEDYVNMDGSSGKWYDSSPSENRHALCKKLAIV